MKIESHRLEAVAIVLKSEPPRILETHTIEQSHLSSQIFNRGKPDFMMQFQALLASIIIPALVAAGPDDPGFYNTVAEIYSGPNCDPSSFVWADPIFGRGGSCQLLDRNNNTPDIQSYKIIDQYPGCSGK